MNATSLALIYTILGADHQLTSEERISLANLAGANADARPANRDAALTLTQKQAAALLGVDRTTVWRLARQGILHPEEISPGTFRYPRAQIELLAQTGYRAMRNAGQKCAA